jgi:hypothetical protein
MSDETWPTASLRPTGRARALAAGLPGTALQEGLIDAPFEQVWGFISDLERSVPQFDATVARLRILERDGTRLRASTRASWRMAGLRLGFDVDLEEGWCWMVSRPRLYVVAMAAEPDADDPGRTRYVHVEGVTVRPRLLARATRGRSRHHVAADVAGIERALGLRP